MQSAYHIIHKKSMRHVFFIFKKDELKGEELFCFEYRNTFTFLHYCTLFALILCFFVAFKLRSL